MSEARLSLVAAERGPEWDAMVRRSDQGTLFSESLYLDAVGRPSDLYWVLQGRERKAGVVLMVSEDRSRCELDDLVIYGGVMFDLDPQRQRAKRRHDEFQLTEFVVGELVARYQSLDIAFAPQFEDARPVLWHAYGGPREAQFTLDLRYTSYLDVSSIRGAADPEQSACFAGMETVRRYSVREARRKGGSISTADHTDALVAFYRALMAGQGEAQPESKLCRMQRVMRALIAAGRGASYAVKDAAGEVIYVVFYGWDNKRAYYLFGAGHPERNEPWQGTLAHWEAFKDLACNHQVSQIDLEGVNSPQRGWFKLSLGGDLRTYYQVSKRCLPAA